MLRKQRAQRPKLRTMDRPMQQDFGDQLEAGADRALREGRMAEEGVHEVIAEAVLLSNMGVQRSLSRQEERMLQEMRSAAPAEERPQYFPHFREAHSWRAELEGEAGAAEDGAAPRAAPEHFFSKKAWDAVYGADEGTVRLAAALRLPRPSRIQNLAFHDVARGRSAVVADQAGAGKTLAYLLPLLQRHVLGEQPAREARRVKLLVLAPTSDLAEQIMRVARSVSALGPRRFRVHCCTARGRAYDQRQQLRAGTDVLVATAGRLRALLAEPARPLDLGGCGAVVLDEVDVLVDDEAHLSVEDLRTVLPPAVQWVFVTATLTELARRQLDDFEAGVLLAGRQAGAQGAEGAEGAEGAACGLAWHTGPGLHRVSPRCEHVIVDCTPERLHDLAPDHRLRAVMRQKVLALAWHLRQGVLSDVEDSRVVVFCNTIPNCQFVENELRKLDPRDRRTGARRWRVLVLHGRRSKEDYRELAEEFASERPKARDFFKKRILVCTDRLSRGMDFSRRPVSWVVLLDWPRDATEYLRRVGRTARGGGRGGVLSFPSGLRELRMAKQVTAAAVQGRPLQGRALELDQKAFCLERFDPRHADWRSGAAAAPLPQGARGRGAEARGAGEGEGAEAAEEGAARPWSRAEGWGEVQGWQPWADGRAGEGGGGDYGGDFGDDFGDDYGDDFGDDDGLGDDLMLDSAGVSLGE